MDYRLTFPDKDTWLVEADKAGWVQREYEPAPIDSPPVVKREWIYAPSIDIVDIGTIYEPIPPTPPDQTPPEPVPYPGYAVNVRCNDVPLPDNMIPFIVYPNNPRYTFAGGWYE
jgi:hypothetical protein